jgi:hypothetical protein
MAVACRTSDRPRRREAAFSHPSYAAWSISGVISRLCRMYAGRDLVSLLGGRSPFAPDSNKESAANRG